MVPYMVVCMKVNWDDDYSQLDGNIKHVPNHQVDTLVAEYLMMLPFYRWFMMILSCESCEYQLIMVNDGGSSYNQSKISIIDDL